MDRFIRQFKSLPWRWLFQSAGVATAIVAAIEWLLAFSWKYFPPLKSAIALLYSPPFGMLMVVLVAIGLGVLAVYLLERWQPFLLNAGSLWALMGCLLLALFVKSLLPIPPISIDLSRLSFIGILIGVSWKGRPYFR